MSFHTGKKLVICDLDNTLYDWVSYFVKSFYSMVEEVVRITKCDRETLLDDFQSVHRKYGDSEHPFSLLETRTVLELFPSQSAENIARKLDSALLAFNRSRKRNLHLYPGVYKALTQISGSGVGLVAYTESNLFAAADRINRLGLGVFFDQVYCRRRAASEHPSASGEFDWFRRHAVTKFVELPSKQRKPDADVLREICSQRGLCVSDVAHVGDSITRDVLMAREAGVYAIWAKYGANHTTEDYRRLVRITHWTDADVEKETELKARASEAQPDAVLEEGFWEVVEVLGVSK